MIEKLMTFLSIGEEWVLWLLIVVSIICLALFIERFIVIYLARASLATLKSKLDGFLAGGRIDEARQYFSSRKTTPARILAAAFNSFHRSPEAMQEMIDAEVTNQRLRLERGLDFLGSVGSNAPFVGLFGTVLGIIMAFQALSTAKTAEPQVVMAGISSALIATAVGLGVAIPALVFYNFYKGWIRDIMRSSDTLTKSVVSYSLDQHLGRPGQKKAEDKSEKAVKVDAEKPAEV